jgi:hypothetical protein
MLLQQTKTKKNKKNMKGMGELWRRGRLIPTFWFWLNAEVSWRLVIDMLQSRPGFFPTLALGVKVGFTFQVSIFAFLVHGFVSSVSFSYKMHEGANRDF